MKSITEADRRRVELLDELKPELEKLSAEIERDLSPFWEGALESLRTIITVSGGALVASISVVQFLTEKATNPDAGVLLPVSWVLFGLTILAAMQAQSAMTDMRLFRWHASREVTEILIVEQPPEFDYAAVSAEVVRRVNARFNPAVKRYTDRLLSSAFHSSSRSQR